MSDYIVPLLLFFVCCVGLRQKCDPYARMVEGAEEGLRLLFRIIPSLVLLMTSISMLRESGAMEWICKALSPVFSFFGIPPETGMLVLIRPISGSAALAVGSEIMATYGVDSLIGRTAAIMLGSTETTFYTISIYFGSAGIKKTRYTIPAALIADMTGFLVASLTARIMT